MHGNGLYIDLAYISITLLHSPRRDDYPYLKVVNYIPYLASNAHNCRPRKPSGTRVFCGPSRDISVSAQSGVPDRHADGSWSKTKINKNHRPVVATPSGSECSEDDNISRLDDVEAPLLGGGGLGEEQSSSGDEAEDQIIHSTELTLREEAHSLYHLLTHKPNNPFCESCRRAKMK